MTNCGGENHFFRGKNSLEGDRFYSPLTAAVLKLILDFGRDRFAELAMTNEEKRNLFFCEEFGSLLSRLGFLRRVT